MSLVVAYSRSEVASSLAAMNLERIPLTSVVFGCRQQSQQESHITKQLHCILQLDGCMSRLSLQDCYSERARRNTQKVGGTPATIATRIGNQDEEHGPKTSHDVGECGASGRISKLLMMCIEALSAQCICDYMYSLRAPNMAAAMPEVDEP